MLIENVILHVYRGDTCFNCLFENYHCNSSSQPQETEIHLMLKAKQKSLNQQHSISLSSGEEVK
jgi:hypothetical protein